MIMRVSVFLAALLLAGAALAQKADVFSDGGAAIRGYDPVAYFTEGKPVKGKTEFTHSWKGATWRFASAANRDRFAAAPEKYAPQYGGYCAYGVASGYAVKTEPDAWSVVDGKLYLNYDRNVQAELGQGHSRLHPQGGRELAQGARALGACPASFPYPPSKKQAAQQQRMKSCSAQASKKDLKGDERQAFMSECLKA